MARRRICATARPITATADQVRDALAALPAVVADFGSNPGTVTVFRTVNVTGSVTVTCATTGSGQFARANIRFHILGVMLAGAAP